ncbi:hypothetical protein ACX1NA_03395, partial [Mycoplasma sp. VS276A1]
RKYDRPIYDIDTFVYIPANKRIKQINLAGFWIEWLKIREILGEQPINIKNNIYTKIIFW